MKGLFKNVALGFGFYIGWEFAKGLDTALGAIYGESIRKKGNEIQDRINKSHEETGEESEQETKPYDEESEFKSLHEEMLHDIESTDNENIEE